MRSVADDEEKDLGGDGHVAPYVFLDGVESQ